MTKETILRWVKAIERKPSGSSFDILIRYNNVREGVWDKELGDRNLIIDLMENGWMDVEWLEEHQNEQGEGVSSPLPQPSPASLPEVEDWDDVLTEVPVRVHPMTENYFKNKFIIYGIDSPVTAPANTGNGNPNSESEGQRVEAPASLLGITKALVLEQMKPTIKYMVETVLHPQTMQGRFGNWMSYSQSLESYTGYLIQNIEKALLEELPPSSPQRFVFEAGEEFTIEDLPSGSLFIYGYLKTIALKSEYRTEQGACECYILESGEMFWGGVTTAHELNQLKVKSIYPI